MIEAVKDHFLNPHNVGDADEPRFTGRAGSFVCGAAVRLSIHLDESHNVAEARFKAAGCEVLIASLSILTERVRGKTTTDAALIGQRSDTLTAELSVEKDKVHCVQLACDALVAAIREYSEATRTEWNGDEVLICTCFFVSERTI